MTKVRLKRTIPTYLAFHRGTTFELAGIVGKYADITYTLNGQRRGLRVDSALLEEIPEPHLPSHTSLKERLDALESRMNAAAISIANAGSRAHELDSRICTIKRGTP